MRFWRGVWEELTGLGQTKRDAFTVLRIAAERIREVADEHHATYSEGMRLAADLIDPDKEME